MVEQESQVENVIPAAPITNEIFVHPPMHEAFATPIANENPVAPQVRETFATPMTNESPAALPMRYPFATPAAPAAPSTNENPVAPPMRYAFATPMTSESPAAPPMRYAFATPITKENPVVLSVQDLPVLPMDAFVSQIIGENATRKAEERSDYTAIPVTFEKMGKTAFPADLLPVDPMAEEKADGMEKPLEVITPVQQAKTPKVS
ncbi:MAG: hypothetical protein LBU41_03035, partial [Clostridiales Family XIII bacterium]|nr:hypothetical protein [Clostridiales Family XIII bacterium]